jgi:hypothetical protein
MLSRPTVSVIFSPHDVLFQKKCTFNGTSGDRFLMGETRAGRMLSPVRFDAATKATLALQDRPRRKQGRGSLRQSVLLERFLAFLVVARTPRKNTGKNADGKTRMPMRFGFLLPKSD